MAIKSGFFSSTNGDRKYNKDSFNEYFDGLVSEGVYRNFLNAFAVTAGAGMKVLVGSGRARINSYFVHNTTSFEVDINTAHATLNRYTAIILRINMADRTAEILAIDGLNASTPTAPTVTRNNNVYDLMLALIYVGAGVTTISNGVITDKRDDVAVCGYASLTASIDSGVQIQRAQSVYTLTADSANAQIDALANYNPTSDILQVFYNGLYQIENVDFTVSYSDVEHVYIIQKSTGVYTNGSKVVALILRAEITS